MKNRGLIFLVGCFTLHFLFHAGFGAFAFYEVTEALRSPEFISDAVSPEMRANYEKLVPFTLGSGVLGVLGLVACIGFFWRSRWAMVLWLMTSLAFVCGAALVAVIGNGLITSHLYGFILIALSWWSVIQRSGESHER